MEIIELIKRRIAESNTDWDILTLKGFSNEVFFELSNEYQFIDESLIIDGKIDLFRYNSELRLILSRILASDFSNKKGILLYETYLASGDLKRHFKILVIENNLLQNYPNQSNIEDIPDFSSIDEPKKNDHVSTYSAFYSNCIHENGAKFVEFMDIEEDDDRVCVVKLIDKQNSELLVVSENELSEDCILLYNATLTQLERNLFSNNLKYFNYYKKNSQFDESERIQNVLGYAALQNIQINIYDVKSELEVADEQNLNKVGYEKLDKLLKDYWGYNAEFRKIKVYKDPSTSRETIEVSQKSVIIDVVKEAIKGINGNKNIEDLLLTAPTGAGKSLLFQLAAIYLEEEYKSLTLIITPLQALMVDQVKNINHLGYKEAAFIHGSMKEGQEDKEAVLKKVREGKINILYLSPEMLQAISIDKIIGKGDDERQIGLCVIDEAHCVTTWGQEFRVEYWSLGKYLVKLRKQMKFPIFALTATAVWDPNGKNDMVHEIIRTLRMENCKTYIGDVKRENIEFKITYYDKFERGVKDEKTNEHIANFIGERQKSIVYFPMIKTLKKVNEKFHDKNSNRPLELRSGIRSYYSRLQEKETNAQDFKGKENVYVMMATKAYGMGIDIPSIQNVYHHEPNGYFSDYIQEIGRAARDANMTGNAIIDYSEKDLGSARLLRYLNQISPYQMKAVFIKLYNLYLMQNKKSDVLVTVSDFDYIFPLENNEENENDKIDSLVKRSLLYLEDDLNLRSRNSIVVNTKSSFAIKYYRVGKEIEEFKRIYDSYLEKCTDEFVAIDEVQLSTDTGRLKDIKSEFELQNQVKINYKRDAKDVNDVKEKFSKFLTLAEELLAHFSKKRKERGIEKLYFSIDDFNEKSNELSEDKSGQRIYDKVYLLYGKFLSNQPNELIKVEGNYKIITEQYKKLYAENFNNGIEKEGVLFVEPNDPMITLFKLLNSLDLVTYNIVGGKDSTIYIRINNPYIFRKISDYKNTILEKNKERFEYSLRVYNYFFKTPMTDKERWVFVEGYFLGIPEAKLLNKSN